jgi:hypothetical protein
MHFIKYSPYQKNLKIKLSHHIYTNTHAVYVMYNFVTHIHLLGKIMTDFEVRAK